MYLDALEKVINEDTIPFDTAEKYLNLFLGASDWDSHIKKLWKMSGSKGLTEEQRKAFVKKTISCATMLPLLEGTTIPTPPDKLLFWCTAWTQFNERDWFELFKENIKCSVQQFIQQRRIELAITLFHHSNIQIEEVAIECGFYDRHHFSRIFKRNVGISPGIYWKKIT